MTRVRERPATVRSPARPRSHDLGADSRTGTPLGVDFLLAIGGGVAYTLSFPSHGWWPLAFLGIGMILYSLIGQSTGAALLLGFTAGLSFWLTLVAWTSLYLGPAPWLALSAFEALFFMLGAWLIALAYRYVPRAWPTALGRLGLLPVIVAGLWTAREAVTNVWPYGGFAWGRAALSQSESPLASLTTWVGLSGLTFLMVWLCALTIQCARERGMRGTVRAALAVAAGCALVVVPVWPTHLDGQLRIAAVQGNGPAGYFERAQPGDVLLSQMKASLPLVGTKPDLVVWPEGAVDLNALADPSAAAALDFITKRIGAPLVTGTWTTHDGKYYNSSLLWKPGVGPTAQYDKKHLVPFGEYVPNRSFWRLIAPNLIDLLQRDETPGTRSNVFDINGTRAGISICFDIADDSLLHEMVSGGAQVILAQTNNADFGRTEENEQQLAIARLRAIESGRSLVNISTVGTSQIVGPDGRTITQLPAYRPGAMTATVPLATGTTPGVALGQNIELLCAGLGLGGLAVSLVAGRSRRRRGADKNTAPAFSRTP